MKRFSYCVAIASLCAASIVSAQTLTDEQLASLKSVLAGAIVRGYERSIAGETINYHSASEHVRAALLARATDGTMRIEWQTAHVPLSINSKSITFIWMAGMCVSYGSERFDLAMNGAHLLSFSNPRSSDERLSTWRGTRGATLRFAATNVDQFGDLFGYAFLTLPASMAQKGKPLTLSITGSKANNRTWVMTFETSLESQMRVDAIPALMKVESDTCQEVRVSIAHYSPPLDVSTEIDGRVASRARLRWGVNSISIPIARVDRKKTIRVEVRAGRRRVYRATTMLSPVVQRELWLLPHSHTDIGYSAHQIKVESDHQRYIDSAIVIAARTAEYPEGSRFKWNIEVMWPLDSYLRACTPTQRQRFAKAVRKGWIGLNALYANLLTGLCSQEELMQSTAFARSVTQEFNVPVRAAMISDIPSYSWSVVTALSQAGIKFFSSGPNYMPTLPHRGDRIGYTLDSLGDRPFYWRSSTGKDSVLFWMAGRGYSWFHGLNMGAAGKANPSEIFAYLRALDTMRYPYEMVQVRYTIGGDNGPPDPRLPDFVRDWNARYISPRFMIATSDEMFAEFERRYHGIIPSRTGDLTPHWEDGALSSARETAMNRVAANTLAQATALYAILRPWLYNAEAFDAAWRQILLWDEHTWGAANSISEPDHPDVRAQWEYKEQLVKDGVLRAQQLRHDAIHPSAFSDSNVIAIDVINTNSFTRSGVVAIPRAYSNNGDLTHDRDGTPFRSQRLSDGSLAVFVDDVPAFGSKTIYVRAGFSDWISSIRIDDATLENDRVRIVLHKKTGAISSLVWKQHGSELVDTAAASGLNSYLHVAGRDPRLATTDSSVSITKKESGPLVASFLVESAPAGAHSFKREIRIVEGSDEVFISDTLDKKAVREKEGVHVAFPFHIPNGSVRIDNGWEIVRPEIDQLPGACKDFFPVERFIDVSNDSVGITLASLDAPLFEIGGMTDETILRGGVRDWKRVLPQSQHLFAYVMNNYWHTNYKADQEGEAVFRFVFKPHRRFDRAAATRFGIASSQSFVVRPSAPYESYAPPRIMIAPETTIATWFAPSRDGKGWILRLQNCSDSSTSTEIHWDGGQVRFFISDLSEREIKDAAFPLSLNAGEVVTLKVERK